uniref:RING-type domain-containing protein n=1 Tax=Heterorhabditis bacteriophora TaxID=37862 RepID=A0A1I7XMU7_HETBA
MLSIHDSEGESDSPPPMLQQIELGESQCATSPPLLPLGPLPVETLIKKDDEDELMESMDKKCLIHEFACILCQRICNDPVAATVCLDRFCASCMEPRIKAGNLKCPKCNVDLDPKNPVSKDSNLADMIRKVRIAYTSYFPSDGEYMDMTDMTEGQKKELKEKTAPKCRPSELAEQNFNDQEYYLVFYWADLYHSSNALVQAYLKKTGKTYCNKDHIFPFVERRTPNPFGISREYRDELMKQMREDIKGIVPKRKKDTISDPEYDSDHPDGDQQPARRKRIKHENLDEEKPSLICDNESDTEGSNNADKIGESDDDIEMYGDIGGSVHKPKRKGVMRKTTDENIRDSDDSSSNEAPLKKHRRPRNRDTVYTGSCFDRDSSTSYDSTDCPHISESHFRPFRYVVSDQQRQFVSRHQGSAVVLRPNRNKKSRLCNKRLLPVFLFIEDDCTIAHMQKYMMNYIFHDAKTMADKVRIMFTEVIWECEAGNIAILQCEKNANSISTPINTDSSFSMSSTSGDSSSKSKPTNTVKPLAQKITRTSNEGSGSASNKSTSKSPSKSPSKKNASTVSTPRGDDLKKEGEKDIAYTISTKSRDSKVYAVNLPLTDIEESVTIGELRGGKVCQGKNPLALMYTIVDLLPTDTPSDSD